MHYPFVESRDCIFGRKRQAWSKACLEEVAHWKCAPGKLYLVRSPFLVFFLLPCDHEVSSPTTCFSCRDIPYLRAKLVSPSNH